MATTVKDYLKSYAKAAAQHHLTLAANETKLAALHAELADAHEAADKPDLAKIHRKLAKAHEASASEHSDRSAAHSDMAKTVGDDLHKSELGLDAIRPDNVHGVITHFPTAYPRNGQPAIQKGVSPQFEKLVTVDDD